MTCTLAQAAGCPEIVACTPCGADGSIHPALLVALELSGATEIYKIGGAQAIGAMAFGTATIKPVVKVFGPGNAYVVEAKRQVFGTVAVDLLPGPSEIMVIADDTARPDYIAADLLAQAEHGGDSGIVFITDSEFLLQSVEIEIDRQAHELSRQEQIRSVLEKGACLVLAGSIDEAIEICNSYAPEHVSLIVRREKHFLPRIRTAGAIFVGNLSPVAVGDFLAGPSHELPTGGAGKSFSGLTVDQFQRRTSVVRLDEKSIAKSAPIVGSFAEIEGLDAHARSATIRTL
jgi:histidinol dehydrogenase